MTRRAPADAPPLTARRIDDWMTNYLSRYSPTSAKLRQYLQRKADAALPEGADSAPIRGWVDEAVQKAIGAGFVDDVAWAEAKTRRLVDRGVSPRLVAGKLAAKGIGGAASKVALASVQADREEDVHLASARAYVRRRRLGPWRPEAADRKAERTRDLARMGRAGFSYDIARRALDEPPEGDVLEEIEE